MLFDNQTFLSHGRVLFQDDKRELFGPVIPFLMAGPSARGAATAAEPSAEENARMEARSNELVAIIGPAVFLNVISGAMLWTARQAAVRPMFNSAIEMTVTLTRLGSLGALMEFLINPVVGKLSDVYGRRALIYWGNLSTVSGFSHSLQRFTVEGVVSPLGGGSVSPLAVHLIPCRCLS